MTRTVSDGSNAVSGRTASGASRRATRGTGRRGPELVGSLHDLGVPGGGQDGKAAVGEEVEHLGGVVEADEVLVPDHQERGSGDRPDLLGGPAGHVVDHGLQALEEREEVIRVGRHRLVRGLPDRELLLRRQARIVLLGCGDLGVVAVGADVRGAEHEAADLGRVPHGEGCGGEGAEAEAPHVDGPAARDPVDQLGDVIGEPLDRHGATGVRRVAVALELDADHPAALGEPREDVVEAAVERHDAAVQGDQRWPGRVAELLVPDGDAVDLLGGHALLTLEASRVHRPAVRPRAAGSGAEPFGQRDDDPLRPPGGRSITTSVRESARDRRP